MNASLVKTLPVGRRWQYEPQWNGLRCLGIRERLDLKYQPGGCSGMRKVERRCRADCLEEARLRG